MEVIALVGPSGTGKSHRALLVASEYKVDAIIDDGILIKNGKIIAGVSAKKEKSKLMAIRRAIFILPGHAEEVRNAIKKENLQKILILGTSDNMVEKIATMLFLPKVKKIIRIEDIATKKEIEKASYYRRNEGKHIIPVPTIELKHHFSGYLLNPLQSLFKKKNTKKYMGEKSIVRPPFSYYGKLFIDDAAIKSIFRGVLKREDFVQDVFTIKVEHVWDGMEDIGIDISAEIAVCYGKNIVIFITKVQKKLKDALEYMTGMVVHKVNIKIKTISVARKN